jgi:uroporphyrinogen-III synthase
MSCWRAAPRRSSTKSPAVPNTPNEDRALGGIGVLITRPAHQAGNLIELVEGAGGIAIAFPTIEIVPPTDPGPLLAALDRLAEFDLAVFISPNAVEQTFGWLRSQRRLWPSGLPVAAVGRASARALERFGAPGALVPDGRYDSEALLALAALQRVTGKRIAIFRGDGGRELLGDTLAQRGATVSYVESYRRVRPRADATTLIEAWQRGEIHVVSVTSTEGLRNLYHMLGDTGRGWLLHAPIVVLSEAQAAVCRELGCAAAALIATEATDEAILETIRAWRLAHFSL